MLREHIITSPDLAHVRHGFFTRQGGVSKGVYASLNCSVRSGDEPAALAENRRRVARALGVKPSCLVGLTQVHGNRVLVVEDALWSPPEKGPEADGMVTMRADIALGVLTADCAPVLFATRGGDMVGAAHAGWRSAASGVLENVVEAMCSAGAHRDHIHAVVGPCIGALGYEVGCDMREEVCSHDVGAESFFITGARAGHFLFDLSGYCMERLRRAGVRKVGCISADTLNDDKRFFSHRRRTLAGGGPIGHQISAISCMKA